MHDSIWQAIANIPWWIYGTFIYLLRLGFLATKPRIISIKSILILPGFLIFISLLSIYLNKQFNFLHFLTWLSTFLLGTGCGWLQFRFFNIKAIKNEAKLYVPGTWSLLIVIVVSFSSRLYFLNASNKIDFALFLQPPLVIWLFALYGLLTGLFFGRITYALRCLKVGPYLTE